MSARQAAQCCGSAQDLYTLVLAKVEKVGIPGDDPFRFSFDRALQDTIVIRIFLDDIDALPWMDEPRDHSYVSQERLDLRFGEEELRVAQNSLELIEQLW